MNDLLCENVAQKYYVSLAGAGIGKCYGSATGHQDSSEASQEMDVGWAVVIEIVIHMTGTKWYRIDLYRAAIDTIRW